MSSVGPAVGKPKDEGMMGKMGDMADKILGLPDRPNSAAWRRVCRIVFSVAIIILGAGLFFMMNHGAFGALANPSISTMMSMPLSIGITGVGIAWLLEDVSGIFGRKAQRGVGKILAIAMPILLAGGAAALMMAGFHGGLTATAINGWFFAGILLLPLSVLTLPGAINAINSRDANIFIGGPPEQSHNSESSKRNQEQNVRSVEESKRNSSSFSRRMDNEQKGAKTSYWERLKFWEKKEETEISPENSIPLDDL